MPVYYMRFLKDQWDIRNYIILHKNNSLTYSPTVKATDVSMNLLHINYF